MMKVCKVQVLLAFIFYAANIVTGKVNQNKEGHLPIEIVLNTEKGKELSARGRPDLMRSENKEIELKIQSHGKREREVDLIIAATKEIAATEKDSDRYSPLYNAEHSIPKEAKTSSEKESDTHEGKTVGTSRQDNNNSPFYQSSGFSNILPFEAMRQALEQPQSFILGRNQFSPLQTLRHFEENLSKELHPHMGGNMNLMSYGMIGTQPLFASNIYHHGLMTHPRFPGESHILSGIPFSYNQPYGSISSLNTPVPLIHNLPVHHYPLMNSTPKSPTSEASPPEQGRVRSTPLHHHNSGPHQEINMHRNPEYNIQSHLPERHVPSHPHQPEYSRHRSPHHSITDDNRSLTSGLRQGGSSERDHPSIRDHQPEHLPSFQHQSQHINNEDRQLYYSPIRGNDHPKTPLEPYVDSKRPREYNPVERPPFYPPRDYNMNSNAHNQLPNQHLPSENPPGMRPPPTYSVVPQESLPKYLQNSAYNTRHLQPNRPQLPEDVKLSQHHRHYSTLPENRGPVHQSHPDTGFQPGSLRPRVTMEDSLSAVHRHRHIHPDSTRHYHRNDDDLKAKLDEKQRLNYKINDLEDSSLPYSNELKKYRKASLKQSDDDLESHSSHKYVIKIG